MGVGRCFGLGVGPGDPELLTLKALRHLREAPVVAGFAAVGKQGNAWRTVEPHLRPEQELLRLVYPITTEVPPAGTSYETLLVDFYDESAKAIAEVLDGGRDVAVVCEGDPFFYGSFMYLHSRLAGRYPTHVVPGVPSVLAGAAVAGAPLVSLEEVLVVLPGTLSAAELDARLDGAEAVAVMKLGRNLPKVRAALERAGLLERAWYVERATMESERVLPLVEVDPSSSPYFSLVVVPSATASAR